MLGGTLSIGCCSLFGLSMHPNILPVVKSEIRDSSMDINVFVKFVPKKTKFQAPNSKKILNSNFQ
jgi:hypothetical protein